LEGVVDIRDLNCDKYPPGTSSNSRYPKTELKRGRKKRKEGKRRKEKRMRREERRKKKRKRDQ